MEAQATVQYSTTVQCNTVQHGTVVNIGGICEVPVLPLFLIVNSEHSPEQLVVLQYSRRLDRKLQ